MYETRRYRLVVLLAVFVALAWEPAQGVSRLSYSRPGAMMRIPFSSVVRSPYLFSAGFVAEVVNVSPYSSATGVYFDSEMTRNLRLGMTAVSTIDTTTEIGFHLQQRLWSYGNISFSLGLQDIVLTQSSGRLSMDPDLLSFLGVISSEQKVGRYLLNSYMGFGTGALAGAIAAAADTSGVSPNIDGNGSEPSGQLTLGVYAGFLLKTPLFASKGGLDVVGEFDGKGINVGVRIPITSDYRLQVGFVHLENLPQFGSAADSVVAPAIVIGLDLSACWTNFYQGNFRDALQEVEMAIQLNPDLAIAYARRGSIYFKLGDVQRATINWNLALKLDPEYDDVRNILRGLKEGRIKTTSLKLQ